MAKYIYKARNFKGEESTGETEIENQRELAKDLRKKGYILISANLKKKKSKFNFSISIPFLGGVSTVSKLMFARNLKVLIAAGISLPRALEILSKQGKSKKLKKALLKIREEIMKGRSFSDALERHTDIFSELFVNMIRVGEETGTLEDVLGVLIRQMEKDHQLKSRIKGAMVYPAVIVFAMILIGTLMLILVVPKLAEVFESMHIELPATTRAIIIFGSFMGAYWYLIPIIFFGGIFLTRLFLKLKFGKLVFSTIVLKIPLINKIVIKTNSAYTIRTLSSLISAGVPIVRSLEIVSNSLTNIHYKRAIGEAAEKVRKGSKLAEILSDYRKIYPNLIIQMVQVGEETGETSEVLKKLSDFYEEEVSNATKNLSAIIEPVLMLIVGAAVAFFAISMIQPIYGMMETL